MRLESKKREKSILNERDVMDACGCFREARDLSNVPSSVAMLSTLLNYTYRRSFTMVHALRLCQLVLHIIKKERYTVTRDYANANCQCRINMSSLMQFAHKISTKTSLENKRKNRRISHAAVK